MQIGSGTLVTELGLTYFATSNTISYGSQLKGVLRLGENNNDYKLGNRYILNNWLAVKATDWISFSARLEGLIVGEIEGVNSDINPMMVITADTNNSGGTFKNLRFGFEFATPLLQDVNEVQLKTKETVTLGLQYAL